MQPHHSPTTAALNLHIITQTLYLSQLRPDKSPVTSCNRLPPPVTSCNLLEPGHAGPGDTIASDRQVALQLLASPVSQEPQGIAALEAFLFAASAQLPVSVQPFQLIKSADPDLADAVYLSGDCHMTQAVSAALMLSDRVPG